MRKQPVNILLSLTLLFAGFLSGFFVGRNASPAPVRTSSFHFVTETTSPAQLQTTTVPAEVTATEPETQAYEETTEVPTHPPVTEVSSDTKATDSYEEIKSADVSSGLININTASAAELETLPGIGEVIAQRIVDYRNTYGPFKSTSALINVKGIGEKRLAAIINLVTI